MTDTHPIFIVSPSLPGVFSFSEPDGAPWVLRLPRAGVRAGHGREGSHLHLLLCTEDLSLNIKALLYLATVIRRSLLVSFLAEILDGGFVPLVSKSLHVVLFLNARVKCIPKADKIIENNKIRLKVDRIRFVLSALRQKSAF